MNTIDNEDREMDTYINRVNSIVSQEDALRITWDDVMDSQYDGSDIADMYIMGIRQRKQEEVLSSISSIKMLDKRVRKGKGIDVLKLITYLASIQEIRELVFNNDHGIVVCNPKKGNYPEKVVLNTIRDIVMEGVKTLLYGRKQAFMYMDSSPATSVMGKIWSSYEDCDTKRIPTSIEEFIVEEIPSEDIEFWRSIYKTREHLTHNIEYKVN